MYSTDFSSTARHAEAQGLLHGIEIEGQKLVSGGDDTRTNLITKARFLIAALETPVETVTWIAWAEPTRQAALRIAIDQRLFEHLVKDHGNAKTKQQLALAIGADPKLMFEKIRTVAYSRACAETAGPVFQKLPRYLAETRWISPSDIAAGPFQYGQDTDSTVWQWRSERPQLEQAFNNHMAEYHQGRPSWMDENFYPVKARLLQGMKTGKDEVAIVDIGGNVGYGLHELKTKHPDLPGRFVLQDRPDVIEKVIDTGDSIESYAYDFFTKQPVKGARAYFMDSILHDWDDSDCRRILHQIAGVMGKGHSKLLINENIVSDRDADWKLTSLDRFMMALASSFERAKTEWIELLRSAGFRVVGIWTVDSAVESLIEAVLEGDDTTLDM
ncbi:MAG: hypothetical protein Q9191_000006 [Dirinaria sp. TL-2023a]